jgi:hypothetical protein
LQDKQRGVVYVRSYKTGKIIGQQLRGEQESYESMIKVMDDLQGQCIYYTMIIEEERPVHTYNECIEAVAVRYIYKAYQQ